MAHESKLFLPLLPQEIIIEILLCLPVKSLLKFRSVSKSWLSLLSSPQFINTHLKFSTKNHRYGHLKLLILDHDQNLPEKCALYSILYENSSVSSVELDYPVKAPGYIPQFMGSCNGLVCLFSFRNLLTLWNPSTRKWKELPKEPPHMRPNCYCTHGFGYDEYKDDYKLVLVYSSKVRNRASDVKVYSLRADSWRRIKGFQIGYIYSNSGVFLNGALHWDARPHDDLNGCYYIFSFNLATEKHGKLALPSYEHGGNLHWDLMSSGECLFGFCHCESQGHVDLWVMKEYGVDGSWTKFASIPYFTIPRNFTSPLFVYEDGEVLLINGQRLVLFNTRNNMYTDLEIELPDSHLGIDLATYRESLVSPVFGDDWSQLQ